MKAKQSSGLNHSTTGRRGCLALRDYLPCAAGRAGRQEAASNPSAGSHLWFPGPWDPRWLLQEGGRPGEQQRQAHAVPGAGGWGRKGPSIRLGLPGAKEKQRERRQEPAGQREAQPLGLEGERRSRQEVGPVQTPPCQPLPWPGKHPQGSRMSEASAACVCLILSPCDLRLFPAAPSLSLSLCFCVCSLSLPISLSLGFFFLSLCV